MLNRLLQEISVLVLVVGLSPVVGAAAEDRSAGVAPPIGVRGESEGRPETPGEVRERRSVLEKRGVSFAFTYRGEAFKSIELQPRGVTRYEHLIELALDLDTERLGLWPGGKFFIRGQNSAGSGIYMAPGGIRQPISNIEAPDFTQLSQYGLTQKLFGDDLSLDAGKRDVNAIFAVNRLASHFIDPTFTLPPTVPMPTYPTDALGIALFAQPVKSLTIGMGTYNGAPRIGSLGLEPLLNNKGRYFSVFEAHWRSAFGPAGLLHGSHRVGLWYESGAVSGSGLQPDRTFHGDYGVYAVLNQLLYKQSKDQASPEIDSFAQFGWAPSDRNVQTCYVSLGAAYRGFHAGHTLGIAAGHTWMIAGDPAAHRTQMTNIEIFYRIEVKTWLSVQPEMQYFDNADSAGRKGAAPGLRWIAHF